MVGTPDRPEEQTPSRESRGDAPHSAGDRQGVDRAVADRTLPERERTLRFLNEHYAFPQQLLHHAPEGLKARVIAWFRRLILGPYASADQSYQMHLVQHLNLLAKEFERLRTEQADREAGSLYALERSIMNRFDDYRRRSDIRWGEQQTKLMEQRAALQTVESVVKGLERIAAILDQARPIEQAGGAPEPMPNVSYLLFENRYRGGVDQIRERIEWYGPFFAEHLRSCAEAVHSGAPVLELGSGRGELLSCLARHGVPAYGVEIDSGMVSQARQEGLDVRNEDIIEHLLGLPDHSLGGFVAVQVIEHLPAEMLHRMWCALRNKLIPGACLAVETVNTLSVVAALHNYTRDVTHVPLRHPDTVEFLLELAGFRVCGRRMLSRFPDGAILQELSAEAWYPERMKELVERFNRNMRQLNGLLYGFQDYCIIAEPA